MAEGSAVDADADESTMTLFAPQNIKTMILIGVAITIEGGVDVIIKTVIRIAAAANVAIATNLGTWVLRHVRLKKRKSVIEYVDRILVGK